MVTCTIVVRHHKLDADVCDCDCVATHTGISAIHHDEYAERFITRVAHEIIDHYDDLVASRDA